LFALLAWGVLPAPACAEESAEPAESADTAALTARPAPVGVINRLSQGVWVTSRTGKGRRLQATPEFVSAGQNFRTNQGSFLEIRFYDDGILTLGDRTQVALDDPRVEGVVSTIVLDQGIIFLLHDPESGTKEVEIQTDNASIRLTGPKGEVKGPAHKGTWVLVTAEPGSEGATFVAVLAGKGKAEVWSLQDGKRVGEGVEVFEGRKLRVEKGKRPSRPWKVDRGLLRLAFELWKPDAPLLEGSLTDAVLLLVAR